jgi:hypothetical protein
LNKYWIVFVVAIVVKFFLGLVTPFSDDFMDWLATANGSLNSIASLGFHAPWILVMKSISSFWLLLPIDHPLLQDALGHWYFFPSLSIMLLIAMEKAPLLGFDAATALTMRTIVSHYRGPSLGNQAMILWLFNPYVTLTAEMWGQWDIGSAFFLVLACLFFSRKQYFRSGLSLGVAIAVKLHPILVLPVFLIFLSKKQVRAYLPRFSLGVIILYTPALVFFAQKSAVSRSLLQDVSFYVNTLVGYSLDFGLNVYGMRISLLVIAFSLFVFSCFFLWKCDPSAVFEGVLCLYLIVFALSYWTPTYLLNLIPLLTIFYLSSGSRKLPFLTYLSAASVYVLIAWAFYLTSWGHSFFFIPNYNSFMEHYSHLLLFIAGWPTGFLNVTIDTILTGPVRSVFVGVSLWYFIWIFARNTDWNILRNLISRVDR